MNANGYALSPGIVWPAWILALQSTKMACEKYCCPTKLVVCCWSGLRIWLKKSHAQRLICSRCCWYKKYVDLVQVNDLNDPVSDVPALLMLACEYVAFCAWNGHRGLLRPVMCWCCYMVCVHCGLVQLPVSDHGGCSQLNQCWVRQNCNMDFSDHHSRHHLIIAGISVIMSMIMSVVFVCHPVSQKGTNSWWCCGAAGWVAIRFCPSCVDAKCLIVLGNTEPL